MFIIPQIIALVTFVFSSIGQAFDWFVHRYVYTNTVVFNCAWEDPILDLQALELRKDEDTILVITSAGCNVLTYAIHEPKHIFAIDRNPCQNALLEMKIVAIKHLSYEEFWQMFGEGRLPNFSKNYYPKLRRFLSPGAQKFWDSKSDYFDGKGFRNSFYYRGCSGVLAWVIFRIYCRLIPGLLQGFKAMFEAKTIQEQRKYATEVNRKFWSPLFERIVSSRVALSFMNGVPKPQQNLLEKEGGIAVFLRKVFQWLMTESNLRENYFYKVYLDGKYSKDCCPEFLKEENFYKLKNGAVDRISVHTMLITEFLQSHPEEKVSRYILLDHMDWLSESPAILKEEWQTFVDSATEDCRFLYRSASEKANFVKDIVVSHKGKRKAVGELLKFNDELAEKLHKVDRVHTYTSFHIGDLQSN